jgi:hypothetical protein
MRKMARTLVAAAAFAAASPGSVFAYDGQTLLQRCNSSSTTDVVSCNIFAMAIFEAMRVNGGQLAGVRACIPYSIPNNDQRSIVVNYIRSVPGGLRGPAAVHVARAYACAASARCRRAGGCSSSGGR